VAKLAKMMSMSEDKLKENLRLARIPLSLDDKSLSGNDDRSLLDKLSTQDIFCPMDTLDSADIARNLKIILKTLSPREEKILRIKFGISD